MREDALGELLGRSSPKTPQELLYEKFCAFYSLFNKNRTFFLFGKKPSDPTSRRLLILLKGFSRREKLSA